MKQMNGMKRVKFIEVGPRDGFQNVKEYIPTEEKLKIIDLLVGTGIKTMEIGSFVHPKAIPQMKDVKEVVVKTLEKYGESDIEFFALVPNLFGAKAAADCGLKKIDTVVSVSESHNKANINRTVEESLNGLAEIRGAFPEMKIILSLATSFTCPFEGITPVENVLKIIQKGVDEGIHEFCLADTIGQADPLMVRKTVKAVKEALGELNIIAEDLGFMTDEVIELREKTGFPGMKILQFAFNPDDESIDSPHLAPHNSVMYTGTHDNNTVLGWYKDEIDDPTREYLAVYTNRKEYETVPHAMLRTIFASVSFMAIATMQDLLELDGSARMNLPSTIGGNWQWRMTEDELSKEVEAELLSLTTIYRRINTKLKPKNNVNQNSKGEKNV